MAKSDWTPEVCKAVEDYRAKYLAQGEGYVPGVDYALCRVEGCPRTTPEGQVEWCGLAKIGIPAEAHMNDPTCGSSATLMLWDIKYPGWLDGHSQIDKENKNSG